MTTAPTDAESDRRAAMRFGAAALGAFAITAGVWNIAGASNGGRVDSGGLTRTVNVNEATPDRLLLLPQIGPARAAAIVADREANGPFGSAADLDRVNGLGPRIGAVVEPLVSASQ